MREGGVTEEAGSTAHAGPTPGGTEASSTSYPRSMPDERAWADVVGRLGLLTPYESLWEPGERSGTWMSGATVNLSVS